MMSTWEKTCQTVQVDGFEKPDANLSTPGASLLELRRQTSSHDRYLVILSPSRAALDLGTKILQRSEDGKRRKRLHQLIKKPKPHTENSSR